MGRFRSPSPLLSLLTIAMVLGPAAPRTFIACADGSPCPVAVRTCCPPKPCAEHARPVPDRQCVVVTRPAAERMADRTTVHPVSTAEPFPLALLTVPPILPPPGIALAAAASHLDDSPPDQPAPKQGRAPRAPPRDTL